jgi:RNA polymerase sigma factor (sigma-70 family)
MSEASSRKIEHTAYRLRLGEQGIMPSALSELTVINLLQRCAARPIDEAAWQEFVCRYHATIRAFVLRTFNQRIHADIDLKQQFPDGTMEDLIQAVYVKLVNDDGNALERFEGEYDNSIYQYLGIIATNVVRDHFRVVLAQKRPRVTLSFDQLMEEGDHAIANEGVEIAAPSPELQRDIRVTQNEIEEVLNRVIKGRNSARDILIFKLRFFDGMGPSEIASSLGGELTALAISSTLSRVVTRIRPILARKYGLRLK